MNTARWLGSMMLTAAASCATLHGGLAGGTSRPPEVSGEWIDVRHAAPNDTSLWVLRADGYDGTAHLVQTQTSAGLTPVRHQTRYATWYLRGTLADSANRMICFARRLGRDGLTCLRFSLDTIATSAGPRRRMVVSGYPGEHTTGDRVLIARDPR